MSRHLLLRLEAPLMSFGSAAVDHHRPVQLWPPVSLLTGLIGNALAWQRRNPRLLDDLQRRLRWAARLDRPGEWLEDFQTAQLDHGDSGWITRGVVEGRDGAATRAPHLRYRHYRGDASVAIALRLEPAAEAPTLDDIAQALDRPARPLFLGRKGCPPATRLVLGLVDAPDNLAALDLAPPADGSWPGDSAGFGARPAVFFNEGAATLPASIVVHWSSDERRFDLDVHGGRQRVYELPARLPSTDKARPSP